MMRAVYKDERGATYSCPVEIHDNKWMMLTSGGFQPITNEFQDDIAGTLSFVEYRDEKDSRIHVEQGANSFRALQEAGAKATAEYETQKAKQRREMLNELNRPDPQRIRQAREYAAEVLRARKPRGKGVFIL